MAKKQIDDGLDDIEDLKKTGRGAFDDDEKDDDKDSVADDDAIDIQFADDDEPDPNAPKDEESEDPAADAADAPEGDPDEWVDEEGDEPAAKKKADDDDDDELDGYSKSVRKRILRERRLKEEERQKRVKLEQELAALKSAQAEASIESRIDSAIEELEEARRDADTRKEAQAQAKVNRLYNEQEDLKARKVESESAPKGDSAVNPAFQDWMGRNTWFNDKKYASHRHAAIGVAQRILEEGELTDNSPEFYRRLDKELRDVIRVPGRPRPQRDTLPRTPEENGRSSSRTRIVLTPEDRRFMEGLKLDPRNREHVLAYAKEKRNG